jgi:hypothetical protein
MPDKSAEVAVERPPSRRPSQEIRLLQAHGMDIEIDLEATTTENGDVELITLTTSLRRGSERVI